MLLNGPTALTKFSYALVWRPSSHDLFSFIHSWLAALLAPELLLPPPGSSVIGASPVRLRSVVG
jgi:hypothetical protein